MATITKHKQVFSFNQALSGIQQMSLDELTTLQRALFREVAQKSAVSATTKSNLKNENKTFFLFGKWTDFEDAYSLRQRVWKRNSI
jgi:hypothetical protein